MQAKSLQEEESSKHAKDEAGALKAQAAEGGGRGERALGCYMSTQCRGRWTAELHPCGHNRRRTCTGTFTKVFREE